MTSPIRARTFTTLAFFGALLTSNVGQAQQASEAFSFTPRTSTSVHASQPKQARRRDRGGVVVVNPGPGPSVVVRPGRPGRRGVVVVAPPPVVVRPPPAIVVRPPVFIAPPPPPVFIAPPAQPGLLLNSGRSNYGAVTIFGSQLGQPYSMQVVSGGNIDVSRVGLPANCRGFVTQQPDVIVTYQQPGRQLAFFAEGQGDTTLVIRGPNGQWSCSDDEGGNRNPLLTMANAQPGQYEIWVGSYEASHQIQARFVVYDPTVRQQQVVVQPPPPVFQPPPVQQPVFAPDCRQTLMQLGQSPSEMMFCDGAEPFCADALLRAGHAATNLMFCQGVNPQCAVQLLRSGHSPTELMHCR